MKKFIFIKQVFLSVFSIFIFQTSFSQARIVINNNAYMVIDNSAFVVIENPNPNALIVTGTGGKIKSETEYNRVRWRIGNTTGTYTIPFADDVVEGGMKIPYTITIGTAGTGAGFYDFSTYDGPTWNNEAYKPSMVTHMGQHNPPNVVNHSAHAIDRFWIINPQGYSSIPAPSSMVFTYIDAEHSASGNLLPEAGMGAQRFNSTVNKWGDMMPIGSANTTANTVTTPPVTAANFFAAWTLSNILNPLPVTLTRFAASCREDGLVVKWTTASEQNSDYFTVEKSSDFENWTTVSQVLAQGNSNTAVNYEIVDHNMLRETSYYRLKQVDFNGDSETFKAVAVACDFSNYEVSIFPNPSNGNFTLEVESDEQIKAMNLAIHDVEGRLIYQRKVDLETGFNDFYITNGEISNGTYLLKLSHENKETKIIRFVVNQ